MENTKQEHQDRRPLIDINGHIFFVDFLKKKLIPKDVENSKGIPFEVLKEHFNEHTDRYEIPYDTAKLEFAAIDYANVKAVPENVIMVAFPHLDKIDPVAYSVSGGWAKEDFEMVEPEQRHFIATILKGSSNQLEMRLAENLSKNKNGESVSARSHKKGKRM